MKKFLSIFFLLFSFIVTYATSPYTISYQAVVRNPQGMLVQNQKLGIRVSIIANEENGIVVYSEERTEQTNSNGLVSFAIGDDNGTTAQSIESIDWSDGIFYILCEIDLNGGTHYTIKTTTQLTSVPMALYAEKVSKNALPSWVFEEEKPTYDYSEIQGTPVIPTKLSDLENDIVLPSQSQNTDSIFIKSVAYAITESDTARWNEKPVIPTKVSELENDKGFITSENIPTQVSQLSNDKGYITIDEFQLYQRR